MSPPPDSNRRNFLAGFTTLGYRPKHLGGGAKGYNATAVKNFDDMLGKVDAIIEVIAEIFRQSVASTTPAASPGRISRANLHW